MIRCVQAYAGLDESLKTACLCAKGIFTDRRGWKDVRSGRVETAC
jgi:hypothetical protein